jgi:hypothetical protein
MRTHRARSEKLRKGVVRTENEWPEPQPTPTINWGTSVIERGNFEHRLRPGPPRPAHPLEEHLWVDAELAANARRGTPSRVSAS